MSVTLIFAWKGSGLRSRRSRDEKVLREEGWGPTMTDEQLDKCKFVERKLNKHGVANASRIPLSLVDQIK